MARQRKTLAINLSVFDRSKGGSALRLGLGSGMNLAAGLGDPLATGGEGTGSSHAGRGIKRNGKSRADNLWASKYAYGLTNTDPSQEDELTRALRTGATGLISDTPNKFKDAGEEEQYYQSAIRRFKDSQVASSNLVDEAAISAGLFHSGARVGAYGDIGERLQQNTNAAARGLAVDERAFREQALQARYGIAGNVQSSLATQGLAGRAQAETERSNRVGEGLAGRQQSEVERQNLAREALEGRGVAVTEESLDEEVRRNKAAESLQARGLDINVGSLAEEMRRNKAQESLQGRGLAVNEASLGEEVRRNKAEESLRARGLTINESTVAEEVRRNKATEAIQARGMAVTEQSLQEEIRKNKVTETLQTANQTEEERRNRAIESLQSRGIEIDDKRVNAEIQNQKNVQRLEEEKTYGGVTSVDSKTGVLMFHPTLAGQQLSETQKLAYRQLAEQARSNRAQEALDLSDRTGFVDEHPGAFAYDDFRRAFEDSTNGKPIDAAMDFNGDQKVDLEDYFYGADRGLIVADNLKIPTLGAKELEANIASMAVELGIKQETLELAIKNFNQETAAFKSSFSGYLWEDGPDGVSVAYEDVTEDVTETVPAAEKRWDQVTSEELYNPIDPDIVRRFDTNQDGNIDQIDIDSASARGLIWRPGQTTTRVVQKTTRQRVPDAKLAAQKEQFEASFKESVRQFDESLKFDYKVANDKQKASRWAAIGNILQLATKIGLQAAGKPG